MSIESIERELRAGLEGVAWGPFDTSWRHFKTMIFAKDFEEGDCRVADVRGWGYLTGKGHGALGLDPKDAAKISDSLGDFIASCSPENIRALLDELSRLREVERRLTRQIADAGYMLAAYKAMLGPRGLEVAKMWEAKHVTRVHFDWTGEAVKLTGEARATEILAWEGAAKHEVQRIDGEESP